jgi:hypothetical protein
MRYVALVAAAALMACGSDNGGTNPPGDPFAGSYDLATIGGTNLPRKLDTNAVTGGFDVLRSAGLTFPSFSVIAVSTSTDTYADSTARAVNVMRTDTFDLGRLPTQGFLLRRGSVADTIAAMIVPSLNHLALDYRGATGIGTYLFVRR